MYGVENKLLSQIQNYLTNCQQHVLLNGQICYSKSMTGLCFRSFVIFNLYKQFTCWFKVNMQNTFRYMSLFSKINGIDISNNDNKELVKISRWAYQWKMLFNPDINKQAAEVYFSQRYEKCLSSPIIFSNNNVLTSPSQKLLSCLG